MFNKTNILMSKAENVFLKLARSYGMLPGQVENNYISYTDKGKTKHQMAESGKMVENNKMVVEKKEEDKHERKPSADEGSKKQAALDQLKKTWITG